MAIKARTYILFFLLLLALVAGGVGYYLYNKGPEDVQASHAMRIAAGELYERFDKDSLAAGKKFTGKILSVSGEVNEVSVNQQQKKIILLKTNSDVAFINCTMEGDPGNVRIGDHVSIKGICSGIGSGDADLGIKGDVYLTRCYLDK